MKSINCLPYLFGESLRWLVCLKMYISFGYVGAFANVQFSCIINVSYADSAMHGLTLTCVACA